MLRVTLVGLIAGGTSGIPRYAAALTSAMDRVAHEFPEISLCLLTTRAGQDQVDPNSMELQLLDGRLQHATGGPQRVLAEQLESRRASGDLLHFFDLTGPLLAPRRPFVATMHDAAIRHRFQGIRVAHKQVLQPLAVKRARAIVSVSGFARDEAIRHFGADRERIHVIHSGPGLVAAVPDRAGPLAGHPATPAIPAIGTGRYLLYVGNLAVHKNLPFLIHAFSAAHVDAKLVLVGSWGDRVAEVRAAVAASPAHARIELHSGVNDAELDELYRGAEALLLPSLYEGFGFTALEAMSRGCPVLASDIPALREVCGDGAWLLPATDHVGWVQAIERLLERPEDQAELRRAGTATVSGYSWEKTARGVCELLQRTGERI